MAISANAKFILIHGNLISPRCNPEINKKYTESSRPLRARFHLRTRRTTKFRYVARCLVVLPGGKGHGIFQFPVASRRSYFANLEILDSFPCRLWTRPLAADKSCPRFGRFMKPPHVSGRARRYQFARLVSSCEISSKVSFCCARARLFL